MVTVMRAVDPVEVDVGGRVSTEVGVKPASAERLGERHREAAGVGGADQLLRVGSLALLEARLERVVAFEPALAGAHDAGALGEGALPAGVRSTDSHDA